MCLITETSMACGHKLQHVLSQCPAAPTPPSSSSQPRTSHRRATCSKPEIVERSFINDTCAKCDPVIRHQILRKGYELDHADLLKRYIEAKKTGDDELMERLEGMMYKAASDLRAANFKASRRAWGRGGVGGVREKELNIAESKDI